MRVGFQLTVYLTRGLVEMFLLRLFVKVWYCEVLHDRGVCAPRYSFPHSLWLDVRVYRFCFYTAWCLWDLLLWYYMVVSATL